MEKQCEVYKHHCEELSSTNMKLVQIAEERSDGEAALRARCREKRE